MHPINIHTASKVIPVQAPKTAFKTLADMAQWLDTRAGAALSACDKRAFVEVRLQKRRLDA